jgi:predicted dehydrogenase
MPVTHLGVAGLGWLGESLIKDIVRSPEFDVVAVQDVVAERARQIAGQYGVAWCGTRYEDLLAQTTVDAVLICTPNNLHASQAQLAVQCGKHVLVQKPLALSAAEARQTIAWAERMRKLLFVDYTYRFLDTVVALRESVRPADRRTARGYRDGGLGAQPPFKHGRAGGSAQQGIRAMRSAFHNIYGPGQEKAWFFNRQTAGGGALMDLGVHLIDLGLWLSQPTSVILASTHLSEEEPVERSASLRLTLDGVPFDVAVSWNASLPQTEVSFEVETETARLRWENVDGSFFHFRALRDGDVLLDRETTLREDTLRAFASALADPRQVPTIDARVYDVLDQAYGRA